MEELIETRAIEELKGKEDGKVEEKKWNLGLLNGMQWKKVGVKKMRKFEEEKWKSKKDYLELQVGKERKTKRDSVTRFLNSCIKQVLLVP